MGDDNLTDRVSDQGAAAGGPSEGAADDALMTDAQRLELSRRRAMSGATDDADASHQGGMGAQGGQVDFGKPKNYGLPD